ncbi:adenylyltransferase/cytidyltransferase family protein, partial [Salmonella enterica]|uniref:adenylyltransferase/cytidyltransferase family protein n=1 Tax=Salmonella enterica TaxID=28901 RepID=UPI000CBF67D1
MKVRKITHPYDSSEIHTDDIVLILGFFDGVHKGHKAVIEKGVQIANEKGLKSVVMTFDRHPALVYKKVDPLELAYLTTSSRKAELIENLGVDLMYELGFTSKLGALSP